MKPIQNVAVEIMNMSLPKYAAGRSQEELVRISCTACASNRYGLLNKPYIATRYAGIDPEVFVTCLKCGHKQIDAENWYDV